ncbi:VWA domain-containing protein [Sporosarcina highlanderae]|uniref:VWA domain-containing protein n=1 Tax=Sporosarcina highlanderae TaxID=3035916 RepID=A0ABT8JU43_9BACL|nr:VWA domain-containing protein [Sporosarcina highlanderae]MDN4607694.1 VWA domain-containing protein [Sporosarcina highlanderae]
MRKFEVDTENFSVLNTDSFDKRRFKEILEMSEGLRKIIHEAWLPSIEPLLGDIWASLFKMKPVITTTDAEGFLSVNKFLMENLMENEQFSYLRNFTRLNELVSTIGTIKLGEKTNQWIIQQLEKEVELQEQAIRITLLYRQLQKQKFQENPRNNLVDEMNKLNAKLQEVIGNKSESFSEVLIQVSREVEQLKNGLNSFLGGVRAGNTDAEFLKVPLRDKILLSEKIAYSKMIKEIADWAGRFKQIAWEKQKVKKSRYIQRRGISIGKDIENLLTIEFSLYTHPQTRMDFLRRFAEGQTMQFEQRGPEVLKKGPIVLCLDQSDSMSGLDKQAKGFTLALISIARRQRRNLCVIFFSTHCKTYTYEKGKIKTSEMIKLAQTYLRGGTNYELALNEALQVINKSRFQQADIIFITDGEGRVSDSFLESFNKTKQSKEFNVLSLLVGTNSTTVRRFADRVIEVEDFDDEGSYTAFEV